MAPKEVYGIVKTVDEKKYWDVSIPLMFEIPVGFSAGITGTAGAEKNVIEDNRMEIHGNLSQDDDHDEGANGVTWDLTENKAQKDGWDISSLSGRDCGAAPARRGFLDARVCEAGREVLVRSSTPVPKGGFAS